MTDEEMNLLFSELGLIHAKLDELLASMPERHLPASRPLLHDRDMAERIDARFDLKMLTHLSALQQIRGEGPLTEEKLLALARELPPPRAEFYLRLLAALRRDRREFGIRDSEPPLGEGLDRPPRSD